MVDPDIAALQMGRELAEDPATIKPAIASRILLAAAEDGKSGSARR
jgi:hypothetical protein